jgi:hypothetical protein
MAKRDSNERWKEMKNGSMGTREKYRDGGAESH